MMKPWKVIDYEWELEILITLSLSLKAWFCRLYFPQMWVEILLTSKYPLLFLYVLIISTAPVSSHLYCLWLFQASPLLYPHITFGSFIPSTFFSSSKVCVIALPQIVSIHHIPFSQDQLFYIFKAACSLCRDIIEQFINQVLLSKSQTTAKAISPVSSP